MRVLVGYTNQMPEVAERRSLPGREQAGDDIIAFGAEYTHLNVAPEMTWRDILAQCPREWRPDVYIHWSPEYNPVPEGLADADCLTVGVFGDWNLGGRAMRAVGNLFDVLVADQGGCERLRSMGFAQVLHGLLWAFEPQKHRRLEGSANALERDIDILMIGNFNHAIQWERAHWLARVAKLSKRYNVVLTSGLYGDEYVRAMNRAKIVFNRSIRGEANMRVYEAPACGALMFYEAENREIHDIYTDREHCVLYNDTNLETLLDHYLAPEHDAERLYIAQQGWERVQQHSYAHHFAELLTRLEPLAAARITGSLPSRAFCALPTEEQTLALALQGLLTCNVGVYQKLDRALTEEEKKRRREEKETIPNPEHLNTRTPEHPIPGVRLRTNTQHQTSNLHAVLSGEIAACATSSAYRRQSGQAAIQLARRAVQGEPEYLLARVNLAYLHLAAGNAAEAETTLRDVGARLDAGELETWQLQGPTFPRRFDWFDVAVERLYGELAPDSAAWCTQMQAALTCRVQLTLAEMTFARGQFANSARHAECAVQAMPALGDAHYACACACRALGQVETALAAYRQTLTHAPFHVTAREGIARLCIDVERGGEALDVLDEWLVILNGCPAYANLLPGVQALWRQAQALHRQQTSHPVSQHSIKRLLALPDWNRPGDWQTVVRAFAKRHVPADPVLLILRADPTTHPNAQALLASVERYLRHDLGLGANNALPNITLLNQPLAPADCWKLLHVADALIAERLPVFWYELAQARCLPILSCSEI